MCVALCVWCVGVVCVCVTQALQCTCIDGDARMCSRAWMGCMHRVDGAVDSVWCMDVVSSAAIGVDCDWMEDGRVALPAIDG